MISNSIFWPVLAQVFLTLAMYIVLGKRKAAAVKAGQVDRQKAALDNRLWPDDVVKVSNNLANQFETPVLFYVLCFVLFFTNSAGTLAVVFAWLFAASRYVHAVVHVGSNYVPARMRLFMFGWAMLLALLILAVMAMPIAGNEI